MTQSVRPKRVVIVDADNPMEEVHGEFFWREDHERIVAAEREEAYRRGMEDAIATARRKGGRALVVVTRRRPFRVVARSLALLIVVSYAVLIVGLLTR